MVGEKPLEFVRLVDTRRVEKFRRAFLQDEMQRMHSAAPHERAAIYLTAVNTGLRRNEMKQLTIADLALELPEPFLRVRASTEKHPKESRFRLKPEVVDAIRSILPDLAPPHYRVFAGRIPRVRTFKKDLAQAGIPFLDAHGRRRNSHAVLAHDVLRADRHSRIDVIIDEEIKQSFASFRKHCGHPLYQLALSVAEC